MTNTQIDGIIKACDTVARRCITIGGKYHGSVWLFNQCMRAFDCKALPAQAITFEVYIGYPMMQEGEVTIDRDGHLTMRTAGD